MPFTTHSLALLSLILLAVLTVSGPELVTGEESAADYDLSVTFSPESHSLRGTARITLPAGAGIDLDLHGLTVDGLLLREEDGRELTPPQPQQEMLHLAGAATRRELYISYARVVRDSPDERIDPSGIVLTGLWHPVPQREMRFQLSAGLPPGFSAAVESDRFPLATDGDRLIAAFSQPLQNLHFVAGPYVEDSLEVRPGLRVYSLFFAEDRQLAQSYLEAAAGYLRRYEREIGPYPYAHYLIVANRLPTGLGLPTFTLLGQQVLRLPFIRETSLGHEVLHSWFGNSVEVDYAKGNWCEGLTTFLADHAFRADQGQGAADRKERITNYLSYVNKETAVPLSAFRSADHRQPQGQAVRAVGYNRGAMFFQELRELLGAEAFSRGLRTLYRDNQGKSASWSDLQQSFSLASDRDLGGFFSERLDRTAIPKLAVSDIAVSQTGAATRLTFQLSQRSEPPFALRLPIEVTTATGVERFAVASERAVTPVSLTINGLPLQLSIDPDYSLMRQLAVAELPPVWSRFLGARKKLVILESEGQRDLYAPLLDALGDESWTVRTAAEVKSGELNGSSLLFLGLQQPLSRSLFARPDHPATGFTLDVRRHPLNPELTAVLVSSSGRAETAAVAHKLSHYGKYSLLHFASGRNTRQETEESESGLRFIIDQPPAGAAVAALNPFAAIIDRLAGSRVVYVGETHTSMADHHLQLQVIESLHRQNPDLAIGMEMFPTTSQEALDRYTSRADLDEPGFLKASRYFQVWSYDYRFYREIINFARSRRIPVIGLNLEQEVVSTVFKTGSLDALPEEVRKSLPPDRDLDMPGYADWLAILHDMHAAAGPDGGTFGGFIQAQALWDETMAANIAAYLNRHPGRRMVVLAGSEHSRKDRGIPPRLQRRLPLQQATILNIAGGEGHPDIAEMADYFFVSPPQVLPPAAKMGILLESRQEGKSGSLRISGFSPESGADEAGMRKDDVLLTVNDLPVRDMDDVRIALLDAKSGDEVRVTVERIEKKGEQPKKKQVVFKLITPAEGRPHP
jgi:uncharacterized iron-regulated protein